MDETANSPDIPPVNAAGRTNDTIQYYKEDFWRKENLKFTNHKQLCTGQRVCSLGRWLRAGSFDAASFA